MSDYQLFSEWLMRTQILQRTSFGKDPAKLEGQDRIEYVRWNMLAAQNELNEALDEISWKPWASAEFFNRDQFVGELVDVLHFVGNMLVAAKCTDAELNERYTDKMNKNRKRQAEGYTGTDKCTNCRRAMDDVGPCPDHSDCGLCSMCEGT